jgi:hypothetical protein
MNHFNTRIYIYSPVNTAVRRHIEFAGFDSDSISLNDKI